jgi:hypothetical protein
MADSGAVRQQRYKRHRAGDHSMCRHDRPRPVLLSPAEVPASADFDPADELRRLAGRLVDAHRADPGNAALAREARMALLALGPGDSAELDPELVELFKSFR